MRDGQPDEPRIIGTGSPTSDLTDEQLCEIVRESLADIPRDARVLAIIPDKTRDDNTHILFPAAAETLATQQFDVLVAQGTHSPMSRDEKLKKIGAPANWNGDLFDHRWDDPADLVTIGELSRDAVREITGGLFDEAIPLTINRLLAPGEYDVVSIFGATVPYAELVGYYRTVLKQKGTAPSGAAAAPVPLVKKTKPVAAPKVAAKKSAPKASAPKKAAPKKAVAKSKKGA